MNTDTTTEEITEETTQATNKIVCQKCNKQFTVKYFRYIHNLKCEGVIEKDYMRPIRQYNKKIKEEIKQPDLTIYKKQDIPNINTTTPPNPFKDYSRLIYDII